MINKQLAEILGALVISAALGAIGAFLPSWRARRLDPYVMIVGEGVS